MRLDLRFAVARKKEDLEILKPFSMQAPTLEQDLPETHVAIQGLLGFLAPCQSGFVPVAVPGCTCQTAAGHARGGGCGG